MGTCMHEGKWVAKEVGLQGIKNSGFGKHGEWKSGEMKWATGNEYDGWWTWGMKWKILKVG